MRLSIVILNWNTKEYLRKFLPGLLESVQGYDAGVTVADNGSTDGSVRMLEEEFPTVHVIPFNENLGFTGGYNRAFDIVYRDFSPEYFLLLNASELEQVRARDTLIRKAVRQEQVETDYGAYTLLVFDHNIF